MRICHIVESMDNGAVENWLARTYLYARDRYPEHQWTFYCTLGQAGRHAERLREAGANVVASPVPIGQKRVFFREMRAFLRSGRFDVLHCHHDFLSGLYIWAATGIPFKKRFVHVHNTDEALPTPSRIKRRLLLEPMRQTCLHMADGIIGISDHVLDQFLRFRPRRIGRDVVCYYGVDFEPMQAAKHDRARFRRDLTLPETATVLLFVGRLSSLKNPVYVVDVLRAVTERMPNTYAVFVGEGALKEPIRQRATELGVNDRIRILGWRDDTAYFMKNSDVFVFPRLESPAEGLGLVVVEAQACGLPTLTTSGICEDAIFNSRLIRKVDLTCGANQWASDVISLLGSHSRSDVVDLSKCRFAMNIATDNFMAIYGSGIADRIR